MEDLTFDIFQPPKKPLSAYNFFFRQKRAEILQLQLDEYDPTVKRQSRPPRSQKRGAHPSPTLLALTEQISVMWRGISLQERYRYEEMAADDKIRYRQELRRFKDREKLKQRNEIVDKPATLIQSKDKESGIDESMKFSAEQSMTQNHETLSNLDTRESLAIDNTTSVQVITEGCTVPLFYAYYPRSSLHQQSEASHPMELSRNPLCVASSFDLLNDQTPRSDQFHTFAPCSVLTHRNYIPTTNQRLYPQHLFQYQDSYSLLNEPGSGQNRSKYLSSIPTSSFVGQVACIPSHPGPKRLRLNDYGLWDSATVDELKIVHDSKESLDSAALSQMKNNVKMERYTDILTNQIDTIYSFSISKNSTDLDSVNNVKNGHDDVNLF